MALTALLAASCSTTPEHGAAPTRAELDAMSDAALAQVLESRPELGELLEQWPGWGVVEMQAAKIPLVGKGSGYGVVVDRRSGRRSYTRVSRFEIGGGVGAQRFRIVILFEDAALLERAAGGSWHYSAGAEVAAGKSDASGGVARAGKGYRAYRLAESGGAASITVRIARGTPFQPAEATE